MGTFVHIPTLEDYNDSPRGRYLGEYRFERLPKSGLIVFGEMFGLYSGGGTREGIFTFQSGRDEWIFFSDLFVIIETLLAPQPHDQWGQIITGTVFPQMASSPHLVFRVTNERLEFFIREDSHERPVGFFDTTMHLTDQFIDLKIQLDLMFGNLQKSKRDRLEKRHAFFMRLFQTTQKPL